MLPSHNLALREALLALGEQVLPAEHYAFTVSMPEAMITWHNPVIARARIWTSVASSGTHPAGRAWRRQTQRGSR
jgi:hypothetical protein